LCGLDVVHDVDVDIVEDDNVGVNALLTFVDDVSKDDASIGR
jgi:hypothetical protein